MILFFPNHMDLHPINNISRTITSLFYRVVVNRNSFAISVFVLSSIFFSTGPVHAWSTKTSMPAALNGLTSSVVNGKIYAIGGYDGNNYSVAVEEYGPSTDTWSTKTSLPTARSYLTSSVVNGKIYVIGGYNINNVNKYSATVEEYDPSTDTWSTKKAMPTARSYLTSSVVNGKIYVIGGLDGINALATVEEYDPSTDSWSAKTSMPNARDSLTSSVVNGKIYVIGGYDGNNVVATVEEYDPSTDTWSTKKAMPTTREGATNSVVDGKIYVIGGYDGNNDVATVEEYGPSTDTWSTRSTSMPTARSFLTSSVVNGKIYVIGGYDGNNVVATVEEYDSYINTWSTVRSMSTVRSYLTSSVVNGKIYVIGGYDGSNYSTAVEEYDPSTDIWSTKTSMPTARDGLTSSVVNGKIYVIGGYDGSNYSTAVEEYDPSTDIWSTKTSMPTARSFLTSSVVNGKIYVIGGLKLNIYNELSTVEEYDPSTDTWSTKTSMPTVRDGLTSSVVNGKIYVFGGYSVNSFSSAVEEYDPSTDTWSTKTSMLTARNYLTSSVVNDKIYVIGGYVERDDGNYYLSTVEEYGPSTDTWTTKTSMPTVRAGLTSSVVNGKVYVIGGLNKSSYLVTAEEYTVDSITPSVAITSPTDGEIIDFVYSISGTASDPSPTSGIDRVDIQVLDDNGYYLGPDDKWYENENATQQWTTTTGDLAWSHNTSGVVWNGGTTYTVIAKAYDGAGQSSTTSSINFTITSDQAYSTLGLELSSQTILQNETIDASGKLTRLPDDGTDISGETIKLTITAPDETNTTQTTTTYSTSGHYEFEGITGFTQKGTYTIKASFDETDALVASSSDALSVLVGSSAGYAIIVQGKISSEEGLDSHNKTTNRIYDTLLARGFVDENIVYFNYDTSQTGVDASPTAAYIQTAIESWPMDKMNGSPAPLYIIMHDHGNKDTFYLDDETITPGDLDTWLNTLESGLNTSALLEKRVIIYGACYSGSFISVLSKPATDTDGGRIIVTSAAEDEESYKGTLEPDGIRSGSYFLEEFFSELERGYSIKESFKSTTGKTETYTRTGGSSANTNNAYFDSSQQHPLLDDDGDGKGSNALSDDTGDGQIAADLYLGTGVTFDTNSANNPAEVLSVTETVRLDYSTSTYCMWAAANDNDYVASAWMEIRPPSQTLSETGGTVQLSTNYTKELMSLCTTETETEPTDNCCTTETMNYWVEEIDTFTEGGMYEIYYYVKDDETSEISPTKRSVVYKDKTGNSSPGTFSLDSPDENGKVVRDGENVDPYTHLIFEWNTSTDPDGDSITYSLLIATDSSFSDSDVVYKEEEITTTATIVDAGAGLSDLTTYYWKVQAVDAYGLVTDSGQTWPFYTNNTNFGFGYITGIVYDARSFAPMVGATVKTDFGDEDTTKAEGYYIMSANEGAYTVTCNFNGYFEKSFSGTSVNDGKTTELNIPMTSSVTSTDPAPDIKANGSDNTVTIGTGDTLSITVSLSAGGSSGVKCDWWVAESTPDGWYYYSLSTSWTSAGNSYTNLLPTYQGALFNLNTYEVLNTSGLSEGTHTFYFAIDTNMDGSLDLDQIYYDSVVVNVQ